MLEGKYISHMNREWLEWDKNYTRRMVRAMVVELMMFLLCINIQAWMGSRSHPQTDWLEWDKKIYTLHG